jgi:hypothetical protein
MSAPLSINVPFSSADGTAAATIPAALAEIEPEASLTEAEREGIAQLAEEFVAKTEGGSQDPRDPVHQRRWANAQEESPNAHALRQPCLVDPPPRRLPQGARTMSR